MNRKGRKKTANSQIGYFTGNNEQRSFCYL